MAHRYHSLIKIYKLIHIKIEIIVRFKFSLAILQFERISKHYFQQNIGINEKVSDLSMCMNINNRYIIKIIANIYNLIKPTHIFITKANVGNMLFNCSRKIFIYKLFIFLFVKVMKV